MTLNMIAAENTAPRSILEALGSVFNNKTAEGYPGHRYHTGCEVANELEQLAIEWAVFPGTQGTPTLSLIAGKAVCLKLATTPRFIGIQEATLRNARTLGDGLKARGYRPVTGGTDNHMVLVDLRGKGLKGDASERALEEVGILVNRNIIPFDPESIEVTSGLRLGTPGITVRGMGEEEVKLITHLIDQTLSSPHDDSVKAKVREEVMNLCHHFPLHNFIEE